MKSHFFLSLSILLCMGCSHSRFVLHDAAREGSAKDSRRVEVSSKDRLSIFVRADGEIHGIDSVNVVAAEGQYLLVTSEEWETVRQIPRRYLSMSGLRVRSPNSDQDEPTVALPVASIEEIRIVEKDLGWPSVSERIGKVPRWFLEGAVVGLATGGFFVLSTSFLSDSSEGSRTLDRDDWEAAGAVVVVSGVAGVVLYPTARLFWPESGETWRIYRAPDEGFRLAPQSD